MGETIVIKFFSEKEEYFELSNFFMGGHISYNGLTYPSSEHAYQAQKYLQANAPLANYEYAMKIAAMSTPFQAKLLANQSMLHKFKWSKSINELVNKYKAQGIVFRNDWDNVKDDIMEEILIQKFIQIPRCREMLLRTEGCYLQEASPHDNYWGIGKTGKGQNKLGLLLERIRECVLFQSLVEQGKFN